MERIEPNWVRNTSGAEGVLLRVFTDKPFYEVRVAADPKLFLEQNERARSDGSNYWTSSSAGRPQPAAPEQDVPVPDSVMRSTLARGQALYYLMVSYADESRRQPTFSADPNDALRGAFPCVKPRATATPAAGSVAQSLMFDPSLMPAYAGHGANPAGNGAVAQGFDAPGVATAYGPDLSSSAEIKFQGLKTLKGGNGVDHVYFVTSGGTKAGALSFKVKVRNKNDHFNFRKCRMKLVLNRVTDTNPPKDIPIQIGKADPKATKIEPYVSNVRDIVDDDSSIIPFELSQDTINALFDESNPKARLDFEFHWFEGMSNKTGEWYYQRASAAFYLMKPANFLWSKLKVLQNEARFNNYKKHLAYWTPLAEHTFGKGDTMPVVVKGSVTYAMGTSGSSTLTSSSTVTATQTTAKRDVREVDVRVSAERSQSAKVGMKLDGLIDLGLESGNKLGISAGYKKITDITKTTTDQQQFMTSLSESRGFTENFGSSKDVTVSIEAKNPGRIRVLYAYPVFELISVPVVLYQNVDAAGMAGLRKAIPELPILRFKSIGTCIVEYDQRTNEVVGGDCLFDDKLKEQK